MKPWFSGRIPLAPRVIDLVQEGFPLVGGRVDVVNRTPVPSLVYSRRQHIISLDGRAECVDWLNTTPQTVQGYNMIAWTAEGMTHWAVSDLNLEELQMFARLFRAAPVLNIAGNDSASRVCKQIRHILFASRAGADVSWPRHDCADRFLVASDFGAILVPFEISRALDPSSSAHVLSSRTLTSSEPCV